MNIAKKKEIEWINCAKAVAIFAVMIDHTRGDLYVSDKISMASYFSVSLFILLLGMTTYYSYEKNNRSGVIIDRCKNILIDYSIATFIYLIFEVRYFDFTLYLKYLISFDISGPFYYVLLYIQLLIISKTIFDFLNRGGSCLLYELAGFVGVVSLSFFTTNYTNILNVYGGGGKLFGGTYLIMYYLGMLAMKYQIFEKRSLDISVRFTLVYGLLWIIWWYYIMCPYRTYVDALFPFGSGFNPPGICFMVSGILMLCFLFGVFTLLQNYKVTKPIVNIFAFIGKYTLYIFLYHKLFLDYILPVFRIDNLWIKRVIYLGVMIAGSILINKIVRKIMMLFK